MRGCNVLRHKENKKRDDTQSQPGNTSHPANAMNQLPNTSVDSRLAGVNARVYSRSRPRVVAPRIRPQPQARCAVSRRVYQLFRRDMQQRSQPLTTQDLTSMLQQNAQCLTLLAAQWKHLAPPPNHIGLRVHCIRADTNVFQAWQQRNSSCRIF